MEGEAQLQGHLLLMEAKERMEMLKDDIDTFVLRMQHQSEKQLDLLALKAHLAKLEAEDIWEEKAKEVSHLYAVSKIEAKKMAEKTLKEINALFVKLTQIV